jgi:hypothetical protein
VCITFIVAPQSWMFCSIFFSHCTLCLSDISAGCKILSSAVFCRLLSPAMTLPIPVSGCYLVSLTPVSVLFSVLKLPSVLVCDLFPS